MGSQRRFCRQSKLGEISRRLRRAAEVAGESFIFRGEMKTPFRVIALLAWMLRSAALAEDAKLDLPPVPATPPAGSVQLWNGRDLSGWTIFLKNNAQPPPDFFTARDGVLGFAGKITGYARTEQTFSNY